MSADFLQIIGNIADLKILNTFNFWGNLTSQNNKYNNNNSDGLLGERWKVRDDTEWNVFDIQSFLDLYQIS